MPPLTVCQCVCDLTPCGAQHVVETLACGLDRERFRAIVYAFHDGPLAARIRAAGIPVRILGRTRRLFDPALAHRLRARLREDGVDVLHAHLFGSMLHGTVAALGLRRLPRILTVHSVRPDNRLQGFAYPFLFAAAARVVAVSDAVAGSLRRRGVARRKLITIPNGIDFGRYGSGPERREARRRLGLPEAATVLGTVGRLAPPKAHDVLLRAAALLAARRPEARFVLIGDGERLDELRHLARELGLDRVVHFAGARGDIPALLPALDLFVLSSVREGLPLALLEAIAAGVPVVTTGVGGIPEVVRDGHDAVVVPAGDAPALAAAMERLLADPDLARRLARSALGRVRALFDRREMLRRHAEIYEAVAARSPRAA